MPSFTTCSEMLETIRKYVIDHPGTRITSYDDPRNMTIGFLAELSEGDPEVFTIRLLDLKRTVDPRLQGAFRTYAARAELAASLAYVPPLPYDYGAHMCRATAWAHIMDEDPV